MMLRKTGFVLLFCAAILVSAMPSSAITVTTSEAPATYYEISPSSTTWRVERGGRLVPISSSRVKYMRTATYHNPGQQWAAAPMLFAPTNYPQNQVMAPMMQMPPQYGVPASNVKVNSKAKPKTSKAPSSLQQNRRNLPIAPKPNQGGQHDYLPIPIAAPSQQAVPIPQTMPATSPQMMPAEPQSYYQTPQVAPVSAPMPQTQMPYAGQTIPNPPQPRAQLPEGYYQEPRRAPVPNSAPQAQAPQAVPRPPVAPNPAPAPAGSQTPGQNIPVQQPNDYTQMFPPVESAE